MFSVLGDYGSPPTSGSFVYDAAETLGNRFSNFVVVWDGFTFDLTGSANRGGIVLGTQCGTQSNSTSATVFEFLSGTAVCTPTSVALWSGLADPPAQVSFTVADVLAVGNGSSSVLIQANSGVLTTAPSTSQTGQFSIAPVTATPVRRRHFRNPYFHCAASGAGASESVVSSRSRCAAQTRLQRP